MSPCPPLILPAHSNVRSNKHFPTNVSHVTDQCPLLIWHFHVYISNPFFNQIHHFSIPQHQNSFQTTLQFFLEKKNMNIMEKNGLGLETELRLGLPGAGGEGEKMGERKRVFSDVSGHVAAALGNKAAVVGWPPVRKSRYGGGGGGGMKMYVKVSVDGAPFLRKVDLSNHKCYSDLVMALEQLFGCFGLGEVLKDAEKCEYVPIYEDKDGDWMLIGDVPWEMFVESCKRLRIMKRSDAKGIGLHAKDLLKGLAKED